MAEADRYRLAAAAPFEAWREQRGSGSGPVYSDADTDELKRSVREARDKAIAASEHIGKKGSLLPTTECMAAETGDSAVQEAYQIIFRITSPWTHLGGWSLAMHRVEVREDGMHLVVDGAHKGVALRALGAPAAAHLVGSASRICGLGLETEARVWQDAVVQWPAPIVDSIRPRLGT